MALLQAGRASEAAATFARLAPESETAAESCLLAGLVLVTSGDPSRALAFFDRGLQLQPGEAALLGQRAGALAALGRLPAAREAYDAAVAAGADDPALHLDRGNLLRRLGHLDEAVASFDAALRLKPDFPEALRAGGTVLRDLGHGAGALRFLAEAVRLRPGDAEAWLDLTGLYQAEHRYDEALAAYDEALKHCPGHPGLLTNRGVARLALGELAAALQDFDAAIRREPNLPQAHMNRGNALVWLGRPEAALDAYGRALDLRPAYAEALCGRGVAEKLLGRLQAALASTEAALRLDPAFPHARANRGELRLLGGDFARGWPDYEARFDAGRQERPVLADPVPFWTGEPVAGQRLAVFLDQGNGDRIQFARFLPLLPRLGAVVTVVCPPRLRRLLAPVLDGMRVVEAAPEGESFDRQVATSSLPFCLRADAATIPAPGGYLRAEPALVARWRDRLGGHGLRVGLCWRGNQGWQVDPRRSLPLAALAPLAAVPGVRLVSLQLPDNSDAGGTDPAALGLDMLGAELDRGSDAFVDTAALMASLDVVVTCDTAVAHLAGALGRPVFVLLQHVPEWRWMLGTDRSPWYRSARLFRQPARGDWARPVAAIATKLADWPANLAAFEEDAP